MLWRPSLACGSMTLVRAAFFGYKGCKEGGGVGVYSGRGEVKSVVLPRVFISRPTAMGVSAIRSRISFDMNTMILDIDDL